jgi:PAS domain S-box-containing protein
MSPTRGLSPKTATWLEANGPTQLELLCRAVLFHPLAPLLLTDGDGNSREASVGAGMLLGLPREKLIGRPVEEFAPPELKESVSKIWKSLQENEVQHGTLKLVAPGGQQREVEFTVRPNVLPVRHVLVLRDTAAAASHPAPDYALCLLDAGGTIAAWYAGATRVYGFGPADAIGQHVSMLYPGDRDALRLSLGKQLEQAAVCGHVGTEGWHIRQDGGRFWANTIVSAIKDPDGVLQGFARLVRDFSDRHEIDEKLRRNRSPARPLPSHSTIAGIVSGEFDHTPDANDAFLELTGYSRGDLASGALHWPSLTPPEFAPLDEFAHEEGLRFGACTPFEKDLIRKDGSRVPVLVTIAVLKILPFRWIAFVQDLRDRDLRENLETDEAPRPEEAFDEMVGVSAALKRVLRQVEVVAPTDATVLILGETGTGKELVARAIHRISPRKNLPFVTLNCAAIPTGLLESELFGYERGAFTGALSQKIGRFEMAHRGTLFLDEVGDIPLDLQPKLLRALQEKSFERLGGTRTISIDVRLVAATNRNLTQMMGEKLFRSDLYYRLKVFPITTPPLRDRPEDIPILARHFTRKYALKMERKIDKIPSDTMDALVSWTWPGNIRELENFIERSVILSRGPSLRAPLDEIHADEAGAAASNTLEQVEREHIVRVLRESGNVVTAAATKLGLHRTTLNAMMRKLGISRKDL